MNISYMHKHINVYPVPTLHHIQYMVKDDKVHGISKILPDHYYVWECI